MTTLPPSPSRPTTNRPSTLARRAALLDDVLAAMRSGLSDPDFCIADVCDEVFSSRRHVQRVLGEAGLSFRAELARMRMEEAGRLMLEHPGLPVRQISAQVGYRQSAQFAKAFRRLVGQSPTEWRERHREVRREGQAPTGRFRRPAAP